MDSKMLVPFVGFEIFLKTLHEQIASTEILWSDNA